MARFKVSPKLDEYNRKIYELGADAVEYIEKAVKKGADPMADAVRANLNAIPTDDGYKKPGEIRNGLRSIQLAGLQHSLGIAPIRNDRGFINVKIGFDGYNRLQSSRWESGQPNTLVARSIEGGTSYMAAHPFVAPAVKATRGTAKKKMKDVVETEIKKIMGE